MSKRLRRSGYDYDKLLTMKHDMVQRLENLRDAKAICEEVGLRFWLYEGGLLGIYRDGRFIPWDWDVDLLVVYGELKDKFLDVKRLLVAKGFESSVKKSGRFAVRGVRGGERLALNGYRWKKGWLVRKPYCFPERLFMPGGTIHFEGDDYPCPEPIEEYLELAYGDWRTPIYSGDPDDYRRGRGRFSKDVEARYRARKDQYSYTDTEVPFGYGGDLDRDVD
jgi:hypothetical protein